MPNFKPKCTWSLKLQLSETDAVKQEKFLDDGTLRGLTERGIKLYGAKVMGATHSMNWVKRITM